MPTIITRGSGSAQGFGYASSSAAVNYVEDVFSTYLYTGNGSTQTITNGIDLAGEGGLVWIKNRTGADNHILTDSARGTAFFLRSNLGNAQDTNTPNYVSALNSNGFSLGVGYTDVNASANNYASWTFRKQPKFFDIVTYTGTGVAGLNVNHNLGSAPGCMFVKRTDASGSWHVFHTSLGGTKTLFLNATNAAVTNIRYWNDTAPTSTVFTLGFDTDVNASGGTYVAYLFAHNAGGFGLTGTDNVISCGSFTTDGSGNATVSLGYEPQWFLRKETSSANDWVIFDNMRGWSMTDDAFLYPNSSSSEASADRGNPTATGFTLTGQNASANFIYIAIRRGPMKVPTVGTSVFTPLARTGTGTNPTVVTTGTNPDLLLSFPRTASPAAYGTVFFDKLRGVSQILQSANTNAEATTSGTFVLQSFLNTGFQAGADFVQGYLNYSGSTYVNYAMTRAPGFFDEVCYTGTGSATTVTHNLAAVPELMIIKARNSTYNWTVKRNASLDYAVLNSTQAFAGGFEAALWNSTEPTSSVFSLGTNASVNGSGYTYVAYLFATVAGVSKVGTYTGTGTTLQINCGFTAGSRFVLIKRTDATGDWYVWDSARGIVAGNDPYLLLNSTAAEVTGTDYVDTYSAGFEISSTAPAAINANGGSYIFLAIA